MHGLMIAIEHSYKLDRKNYFNLWCELGRLLLRQSHIISGRVMSVTKSIDILTKNIPGVKKGEAKSEAPKIIRFI